MEHRVELRSVSKRFGETVAVDRIDLRVQSSEFLTLLGPSGCGKTTLLRMISGFEQPTEGTVLLSGKDVTRLPPYKRDVNQVFQSYALFPHLNVWENVAFGLKMKRVGKGELRDRVKRAVEMVALPGLEQRMPHQLSGGQKQRVALARALVCEPSVLLLDEPLAALDAKLRRAMQIELKTLQSRLGITFIFVTHDQEEALVMSDRIAVINAGRIEQIGSVSDIYHRPQTRFVAEFMGAANMLQMQAERLDETNIRLSHACGISTTIPATNWTGAESIMICVRPERIRLSRQQPEDGSSFKALVRTQLFRGATDQLMVEVNSLDLTVDLPHGHGFTPGDQVFCQISPNDVVLLKG
jgi:spermidine/putrescine transport system ATP-binding protein